MHLKETNSWYLNYISIFFFFPEEQFTLEFELSRETLKLISYWMTLFGLDRLLGWCGQANVTG